MTLSVSGSRRKSRRADETARRRADALAGASAVFAAKGYHDAQMTEIAASAELSRASLYAMFRSKEELFQEVVYTTAAAIRDTVQSRVEALEDPAEQLLCVIDSLVSCCEENQDLFRIYTFGVPGPPSSIRHALGESSLQVFVAFMDWVVGISKRAKHAGYLQDLDPETVGVSLVGSVTTMAVRWIEATPERPLSGVAAPMRAMFERLLERSASA
jgi:AcrR family transcriptional regulator